MRLPLLGIACFGDEIVSTRSSSRSNTRLKLAGIEAIAEAATIGQPAGWDRWTKCQCGPRALRGLQSREGDVRLAQVITARKRAGVNNRVTTHKIAKEARVAPIATT
jgi:hypothetical protein